MLVGSHAFNTYANMLGVSWGSAAMQTQDMDLASHRQVSVAMRQDAPDVKSLLLEDRPGDIWIALDAARTMPGKFQSQLEQGIEQLPAVVRQAVQAHFNPTHSGD